MGSLDAKIGRDEDGLVRVRLNGAVDEHANIEGIFRLINDDAVFVLRDVERINSIGILHWIPKISEFSRNHRTFIEEVSYPFAQQANLVANMFGFAVVRSCLGPYICSGCNEARLVVVTLEDLLDSEGRPPAKDCDLCNTEMVFDEQEHYFDFFKPNP